MAERLARLAADAKRQPPGFAYKLSDVKTLPPIPDPVVILNAARNYADHDAEMIKAGRIAGPATADATVLKGLPGVWSRTLDDTRGNPYAFPKLASALVGVGDPIILPAGREQIDWECELTIVVGKTAKHVPRDQAKDYNLRLHADE